MLLILLLTFFSVATASTNFYSENSYQDVGFSQTRLRGGWDIAPSFAPYLQLGQDLTLNDMTSSFAYVAPGLQWKLGPVSLFGEVRVRRFYKEGPNSAFDSRLLLVYGDFFSKLLSPTFSLFLEPYFETVFTTADSNNVIATGFARTGVRASLTKKLFADLFLEPFGTVDRVKHPYYNKVDLRASARLLLAADTWGLGAIASYGLFGWRGLLSLSVDS